MLRKILAVVLGVVAGSVFNMAIVTLSNAVYPLPAGLDPNDFEAFKAHVETHGLPTGALIMVLVAHAGGSFVSGFVCGLIAARSWYAAAVGWTVMDLWWPRHAADAAGPHLVCRGRYHSVRTSCAVGSQAGRRVEKRTLASHRSIVTVKDTTHGSSGRVIVTVLLPFSLPVVRTT